MIQESGHHCHQYLSTNWCCLGNRIAGYQNRWRFSARLEVDYLNETYKLDLPEGEQYETLGGLIVHVAEEIPEQGEVIDIEDFTLTILEVSNTKIELVELSRVVQD